MKIIEEILRINNIIIEENDESNRNTRLIDIFIKMYFGKIEKIQFKDSDQDEFFFIKESDNSTDYSNMETHEYLGVNKKEYEKAKKNNVHLGLTTKEEIPNLVFYIVRKKLWIDDMNFYIETINNFGVKETNNMLKEYFKNKYNIEIIKVLPRRDTELFVW